MTKQQNLQLIDENEINLLDYWLVIWKRKKLIGIICSSLVLATMVYSFSLPKIYKSTATVLAIEGRKESGLLSASRVATFSQTTSVISLASPTRDITLSILKSRLIGEKIVDQFNLQDYYKSPYLDNVIKSLQGATKFLVSKEGVISIEVEDKNPKMAADIANAYIEHLNKLNSELGIGTASYQRRFIAERLAKSEKSLKMAVDSLREFQEKHHAISLGNQTAYAVQAAANLKGQIATAEVQLQTMKILAKDLHPEVTKLKRTINELKRQLAESEYSPGLDLPSSDDNPGHPRKELYLPVVNIPQLGAELSSLEREIKVQETIYTLLSQELEKAKIDEAKDLPIVQPLDKAIPAHHKSKPPTRKNMTIALFMGLFLSIFTVFILDYIDKQGGAKIFAKKTFPT